ncbi:hypothetical protein O181_028444 [Austropuccinia psidii MF-1]|uniref:Uncharacterized protein n=1 Tax=Austropuccinia psidii MF-1 TaxID=1389203 RepID=A0A9Q3CNX3_9BASI|nr:hypothetical protein [Austropuccinia psidii MF-1]
MLFSLQHQTLLLMAPQKLLNSQMRAQLEGGGIMKEEESFRKEGRGPRRSNSFPGVVVAFPGISRITLKGSDDEEENHVEEEESDGNETSLLLWENLKVLEHQLYPSLISLSLISLNHIYYPSWNK